ncbi:MAG: hypothetical protein IJJ26_01725 [Victivallales bacterium]|nr:hypothetical protein [Victivallales bacterium]
MAASTILSGSVSLPSGEAPVVNATAPEHAVSPSGTKVFFAGILLNRSDLQKQFSLADCHDNASLLAQLFAKFGTDAFAHLSGPFVAAIQHDGQFLLVRDLHGQQPLYWSLHNHSLHFSQSLPELKAFADGIDLQALSDYLALGYIPAPRTIYRNIYKVNGAHAVTFRPGAQPQAAPWWSPTFSPKITLSFQDAVAETQRLLEQSMKRCLTVDGNAGVLLSGGIDSNLMLGLATKLTDTPRQAFTIGFGHTGYDERSLAELAAKNANAEHFTRLALPDDVQILASLQTASGEPFADSSLVATALAMRLAAEHRSTVITGDGGDELFGGYRRYQVMAARGKLGNALTHLCATLARGGLALLPNAPEQRTTLSNARRLANALALPPVPCYASFQELFSHDAIAELAPELSKQPHYLERWQELWDSCESEDPVERVNRIDLLEYLPDDGCRKDQLAETGTSLLALAPILDTDVTRFALSLPRTFRVHLRERKRMLRAVAAPMIPEELLHQVKRGFGMPVAAWLRKELASEMRALAADLKSWDRQGWFQPEVLTRLVNEHLDAKADHGHQLWALYCLRLWLQN